MGLNGAEATDMPRGANLRSGAGKPGNEGGQVSVGRRIGREEETQGPSHSDCTGESRRKHCGLDNRGPMLSKETAGLEPA